MDNLTHSLIGVVLGEGVSRARKLGPLERAGVLWTSVLASNLPDFDFLLQPIIRGGNLGSLLHHRGYTHTVTLALPLAGLAAAAGRGVAQLLRRRALARSSGSSRMGLPTLRLPSWRILGLVGLIGVLGHLSADFWNDYGVHPFWPFSNHWYYGGFIFIVEPLILFSLLPFAYSVSRSRPGKIVCAALGVVLVVAIWLIHEFSWPVALGLTVWALFFTALQLRANLKSRLRARGQVSIAVASLVGILLVFVFNADRVRTRVEAALPPGETLLALASTPAPSNPFCWKVILTSRQGDLYRARLGIAGLPLGRRFVEGELASLFNDPKRCYPRAFVPRLAPLQGVDAPSLRILEPRVAWIGEFTGSVKEFERLLSSHCRINGLMRFVRIPFWFSRQGEA